MPTMEELLIEAADKGASDLHLSAGEPPLLRIHGDLARTEHPRLFVLICTNYPYPQFREKCLNAGANVFLDKSTEFEKIPDILRGLIENETKVSPGSR